MANIAGLGAGAFGTALAVLAAGQGHRVSLWASNPESLEAIRKDGENRKRLPGVTVPESIYLSHQLEDAAQAELILLAVPSFAVRQTAAKLRPYFSPDRQTVVSVAKGLEAGTLKRFSQVLEEELGVPPVILSGPSHAEEIAVGVPTTVVAASRRRADAEWVQDQLMSPALRIYVSDDVTGVELGGALKNIIALAVGACDGLELGDNARAALMTRGITEIARLGVAMGARSETFAGLSGIGDLIVTCTSRHSRNRRAGLLIGRGCDAQQALAQVGSTVEGYFAADAAYRLAESLGVEMPIIRQVHQVLHEGKMPRDAIAALMERPKRHESETIWLLSSSR